MDSTPLCVDVSVTAPSSDNSNNDVNKEVMVDTVQVSSGPAQPVDVHIQSTPVIQVPIQDISLLLGCRTRTDLPTKVARVKQHSEILTSTPMKNKLEEK